MASIAADILGKAPARRPRPARAAAAAAPTRQTGVSREVFLLTGGATPAGLVPAAGLGARPVARRAWARARFANSARDDALTLEHWAPVGAPVAEYAFARFGKPVRMVEWAEGEWDVVKGLVPLNVVAGSVAPAAVKAKAAAAKAARKEGDAGAPKVVKPAVPAAAAAPAGNLKGALHYVPPQEPWTREETEKLFELCKMFDLRFPVVHDRWPDDFRPRSVDELKDRYYSVSKRLIEHRAKTNKDALTTLPLSLQKHCQAINMNPFDYEYECIRKNQLECQYRRSKAELREEEETVREARRIEANRKRLAKERQRLAKLLTPAGDIAMVGEGKRGVDQALAVAAAAASLPQKTFPHRKVQTGAYARSSMIYTPVTQSARIAKRIDTALVDLGVGTRPTPTSIVVDNFDLLRMDILSYIELQRTVMRKEEDTHLLRVKLAKLKGETPPQPPPGVTLSHKKRRTDEVELGLGSLFGGPPLKKASTQDQ